MNMRYAIHQKTLLYLLWFYKSSQNVSHEMPQHGVPELSCVCVCVGLVVAQQSVSRVLPSYYII